jgi:Tfp pilus assembly protein PilF
MPQPLDNSHRDAAAAKRGGGTLAFLTLLLLTGCRLPCYEGTSTKNVLASRQLTQKGLREIERGQWEDATKLFSKAVQQCPADAEAHRLYGESLWKQGKQDEALFEMSEAVRLAEANQQPLARYAEMRLERGEFGAAMQAAQRALDQDPQSAEAWALRGRLSQSQGDHAQAKADFHQALGVDPVRRDALLGLAQIHRTENQPQRALISLQALADTYNPGQVPRDVIEQEAQALLALNRPADAAASYAQACRCGAPSLPLWMATAECQIRAGNMPAARATIDQAALIWPGAAEIAGLRARLAAETPTRLTARP